MVIRAGSASTAILVKVYCGIRHDPCRANIQLPRILVLCIFGCWKEQTLFYFDQVAYQAWICARPLEALGSTDDI